MALSGQVSCGFRHGTVDARQVPLAALKHSSHFKHILSFLWRWCAPSAACGIETKESIAGMYSNTLMRAKCRLRHWNSVLPHKRMSFFKLMRAKCRLRHWNVNHPPSDLSYDSWCAPSAACGIETLLFSWYKPPFSWCALSAACGFYGKISC